MNDPEHVRQIVEATKGKKASGAPQMAFYSPESARIDRAGDLLQALLAVTLRANGAKKPFNPDPAPRPTTAFETIEAEERQTKHRTIVDMAEQSRTRPLTLVEIAAEQAVDR